MDKTTNVQEARKQAKKLVSGYDFQKTRPKSASDNEAAKRLYKQVYIKKSFGDQGPYNKSAFGGMDSCGHCRNKIFAQLKTFAKGKK